MLAEVQFYNTFEEKVNSEKLYTYRIPIGMKLKKGDKALVYVESDDRQYLNGWRIVKVFKILSEEKYTGTICLYELKYIQSKVDFNPLKSTFEKINRRKELAKRIDEAYKKASKIQLLEMMAKNNPELQEMVNEYKELDGEL